METGWPSFRASSVPSLSRISLSLSVYMRVRVRVRVRVYARGCVYPRLLPLSLECGLILNVF